jgi:DNA repair exonuclease SbcCD ATPase subunit
LILLRSRIIGFGRLRDLSLDFQNKINLVFAANEGGKSTLQRFLTAMLYGQLRSDLRVQRRPDAWVEQYKPWHGVEYGGILWCCAADGREFEIHRSFGKDESHIEIRTAAGEDITSQYEQQRNGEVLFARHHFGMPKEIFESVGTIQENRVAEIDSHESIRDRIANLAQSGDEELSIRQSLQQIQQALDLIGTDRAPTKPYKQAQDLVQSLQVERKALEERREQFKSWLEEKNRISGEISRMERESARAQAVLLNARRRDVSAKVRSLEEIDKEICTLRAEIDSLGARPDFPSEKLEELNLLAGARDSIAKHLNELRTEKTAALAKLSGAEKERQQLSAYADFASSADGEKITEWFVSYLSLSLQKDGIQKTLARLREELTALQERLSELTPALRDSESDWQSMARQAAEDEQIAAQNCAALAERTAREKSTMLSARRSVWQRRILAAILMVLAAMPFGMRPLIGLQLSTILKAGISGAILIVAGILLVLAYDCAKTGRKARAILLDLEAEQTRIREEGGKKRNKFNEVMTGSGFQRADDFLAAARQSEQQRQRLSDLQARHAEAEQQNEKLESQSGEIYQFLKEGLAKVGLSCSPGSLKFQIDVLRSNLRRFRELDASYRSCLQKADSLASEDAELTKEHDLKCSLIQSLLDEARVETPERFREECLKRQRFLELSEREASRTREFQRLAGKLSLAQWKSQLEELLNQQTPKTETDPGAPGAEAEPTPLLPYLPAIDEAEQEVRQIASQLSGMREEYARAVERTHHAFENFRPSFEIDEELALAEEKFRQLERNRAALGIALEALEGLSRQQQEVLAPQLNSSVEQRFLKLCRGRYEEVKIDPDFQVWVRELYTGELRLAEHLSRGTQDQLYFALRFGILDLVSSETEPCPSFMDEPFVAYDRVRLREAFEILTTESERRQLFVFTCREDLVELAELHGANVIELAADNNS